MMLVRMSPDAPTRAPLMISPSLLITKPVSAAARPEYELRSEITTGMSAPPMGITDRTPRTSARPTTARNACGFCGAITSHTARPRTPASKSALSVFCSG